MRYKNKKQHNTKINLNKIKNILSKFEGLDYIGTLYNKLRPTKDTLILFNYNHYTLALKYEDFNYNNVVKRVEQLKDKLLKRR